MHLHRRRVRVRCRPGDRAARAAPCRPGAGIRHPRCAPRKRCPRVFRLRASAPCLLSDRASYRASLAAPAPAVCRDHKLRRVEAEGCQTLLCNASVQRLHRKRASAALRTRHLRQEPNTPDPAREHRGRRRRFRRPLRDPPRRAVRGARQIGGGDQPRRAERHGRRAEKQPVGPAALDGGARLHGARPRPLPARPESLPPRGRHSGDPPLSQPGPADPAGAGGEERRDRVSGRARPRGAAHDLCRYHRQPEPGALHGPDRHDAAALRLGRRPDAAGLSGPGLGRFLYPRHKAGEADRAHDHRPRGAARAARCDPARRVRDQHRRDRARRRRRRGADLQRRWQRQRRPVDRRADRPLRAGDARAEAAAARGDRARVGPAAGAGRGDGRTARD